MATPLVEAIVAHHGSSACVLLTTPEFAPLFNDWPGLEVEAVARHGFANFWRVLRFIRQGSFKRIYDLQGNDRSGVLCALSGCAERVGNHCRFPYTHHPQDTWRGQSHIFARMCTVLESAGVAVESEVPRLPADSAAVKRVKSWLIEHNIAAQPFALLHAGASVTRPGKRWPYFAELAKRLRDDGIAVVWLGGRPDHALNRELAGGGGINATELFSVIELAELGRSARFAVTNDSGPMHVLASASIPVFGLFGPSDWRRNHALGQRAHVIASCEVNPTRSGALANDNLATVSADLVWSRLRDDKLVSG